MGEPVFTRNRLHCCSLLTLLPRMHFSLTMANVVSGATPANAHHDPLTSTESGPSHQLLEASE